MFQKLSHLCSLNASSWNMISFPSSNKFQRPEADTCDIYDISPQFWFSKLLLKARRLIYDCYVYNNGCNFLRASAESMDHNWPSSSSFKKLYLLSVHRGYKTTKIEVIEATEFKFEVKCDLRGYFEVTMASEAFNMAVRANMHMDFRVIEVADYKSDNKFNLRVYWGGSEANMFSEVIKIVVQGQLRFLISKMRPNLKHFHSSRV